MAKADVVVVEKKRRLATVVEKTRDVKKIHSLFPGEAL
jgi:hypothetical protein